ncbi:MAG: chitobiase/beta-hexosaminidase C-terminal domain-containing protein [Candidatus Nanoarchaeia archaeon]
MCPDGWIGGQKLFYLDADKDGFGMLAFSICAATQPENYVDNADDCDDTNPEINPNATAGTILSLNGTKVENSEWYKTNVVVKLSSSNCEPAQIYYRLNNGSETTYTTPFTISAEGDNILEYWSVGETPKLAHILIDKSPPSTTAEIFGEKEDYPYTNWYKDNATINLIATDSGSGVLATYYCTDQNNVCTPNIEGNSLLLNKKGQNYVRFRSVDKAGYLENIKSAFALIDKDTDNDSIYDNFDKCANTLSNKLVDQNGCSQEQVDSDLDGVCDSWVNFATSWCNGSDVCPDTKGKVEYSGCPFADLTNVYLHIVDQQKSGICGYKSDGKPIDSCTQPLPNVLVKIYDREDPAFIAAYGSKKPDRKLYDAIYESDIALIGSCITNSSGSCLAPEAKPGKFLVLAKLHDKRNGVSIYAGKIKNFKEKVIKEFNEEEDDGDVDASEPTIKDTLRTKNIRFVEIIKKDGSVKYEAGDRLVVPGSVLTIDMLDTTLWTDTTELYPFIFTSDSDWTVDVCMNLQPGYVLEGIFDMDGSLIATNSCVQTFVSNEQKILLFSLKEISSPEPDFKVAMTIKNKKTGKTQKIEKDVKGKRVHKEKTREPKKPEIAPKKKNSFDIVGFAVADFFRFFFNYPF